MCLCWMGCFNFHAQTNVYFSHVNSKAANQSRRALHPRDSRGCFQDVEATGLWRHGQNRGRRQRRGLHRVLAKGKNKVTNVFNCLHSHHEVKLFAPTLAISQCCLAALPFYVNSHGWLQTVQVWEYYQWSMTVTSATGWPNAPLRIRGKGFVDLNLSKAFSHD